MMTVIAGQRILAVVLAGGRGSRLAPLTDTRAKPAVPFLGTYRLIDFSLSNLVNSGVHDVWVVEQYLPHGLNDHLSGGRPWDLDRTRGGLVVMPPFTAPGSQEDEFSRGNAHALSQHAHLIREFNPDLLLVLSADHVYKADFAEVIQAHVQRGASVTMVTTDLPEQAQATRFGNVRVDNAGRVTEFRYKPDEPISRTVTAEIFVYDTSILLKTLAELEKQDDLGDYGEQLLPALVARGDAFAHPLRGYWMDVGTLDAYWQAHQDFLNGQALALSDPRWPFITSSITRPPAYIEQTARLDHSFLCGGAVIAGEVIRSTVAPHARIEQGAVVRDSIIQPGAVVQAGARVNRCIVDEGAVIGQNAVVGGQSSNSRLSVIGAHATVAQDVQIGPGLQLPPRQHLKAGQEDRRLQAIEKNDQGNRK